MCVDEALKDLPLVKFHENAGARFCQFAGWSMPISYPAGVLKEHLHTRMHAGLFDISHMQLICVQGEKSAEFLSYALPIEASNMRYGQSRYNFLLNEQAGILDDLIVTRLSVDRFMIVVNAAMAQQDYAILLERNKDFACQIEKLDRVILALQGPDVAAVLSACGYEEFLSLQFMTGQETNDEWFVTRSGYTGEDGFEIALPLAQASAFVSSLLHDSRVMWVGLGARDSLRLEAGLCLYGADLTPQKTPFDANLMWAIPVPVRQKGIFVGAQALRAQMAIGRMIKRVGLCVVGRQPLRQGVKLFDQSGQEVGEITSGGFGPSAEHPVAMGYVGQDYAEIGTVLKAYVRDKEYAVSVQALPFVAHRYYKN